MKKLLALSLLVVLCGCTQNARTKSFGGTMSVQLDKGQKLVNVTWKEGNMWYLTRPMRDGETNETYIFKEKSSYGMMEGTVLFNEIK
jgi:hypothetical protein